MEFESEKLSTPLAEARNFRKEAERIARDVFKRNGIHDPNKEQIRNSAATKSHTPSQASAGCEGGFVIAKEANTIELGKVLPDPRNGPEIGKGAAELRFAIA